MENKLTDKAFKDFGMWHFEKSVPIEEYTNFHLLSDTCKNALIVDWFDSVSIYIGIIRYNVGSGYYESRIHYQKGMYFTSISRQEATNKAIEKANEIYNQEKTWKNLD